MIKIRKSQDRGNINHGWLNAKHTFSFGNYFDKNHANFGLLQVINEDVIQGGKGFGTHSHKNMEIVTYIIKGALEHKDSMGNNAIIKESMVQRMSAGSGVYHSEFNHFQDQETHLLQIWFLPEKKDIVSSYEQKYFSNTEKLNNFKLIVSKNAENDSISINQDINIFSGIFEKNQEINFKTQKNRKIWIQIIEGKVLINNHQLNQGDGAQIEDEENLNFIINQKSEIIIFDMK